MRKRVAPIQVHVCTHLRVQPLTELRLAAHAHPGPGDVDQDRDANQHRAGCQLASRPSGHTLSTPPPRPVWVAPILYVSNGTQM